MTSPCDIYATPTLTWPKQQFPGDHPSVSRMNQGERLAAKRAWNYFEQVESIDAATRIRIGLSGGIISPPPPGTWVSFNGEGQRALYEKGRRYHIIICPTYNWIPQRDLPLPITPVGTVTPSECPCVGDGCTPDLGPLMRALPHMPEQPLEASPAQPRSATLIRQGIAPPGSPGQYGQINIIDNTPTTPLSASSPTSTGSPHTPGTPLSIKEPAPRLEVSELTLQTATPPPETQMPVLEVTETTSSKV